MTSRLYYIDPKALGDLPDLSDLRPFKAVVVLDASLSDGQRLELGRWLVRSGCFFMSAWGIDCIEFHDAVDDADIERGGYDPDNEDSLVMTAWHSDEELVEVLWFGMFAASHPRHVFEALVVIQVGGEDRLSDLRTMMDRLDGE